MYRKADFEELRFGDVLQGFPLSSSNIEVPITKLNEIYSISTVIPEYCVILDPCCSIGKGTISLTPLKRISQNLLDNPTLREDLTQINREVIPLAITHPQNWNALKQEKKIEYKSADASFGYYTNYIYEPHDILKEYPIPKKKKFELTEDSDGLPFFTQTKEDWTFTKSYYMVNFKEVYHIKCKKIEKKSGKVNDEDILSAKRLELTDEARKNFKYKYHVYIEREN